MNLLAEVRNVNSKSLGQYYGWWFVRKIYLRVFLVCMRLHIHICMKYARQQQPAVDLGITHV